MWRLTHMSSFAGKGVKRDVEGGVRAVVHGAPNRADAATEKTAGSRSGVGRGGREREAAQGGGAAVAVSGAEGHDWETEVQEGDEESGGVAIVERGSPADASQAQ